MSKKPYGLERFEPRSPQLPEKVDIGPMTLSGNSDVEKRASSFAILPSSRRLQVEAKKIVEDLTLKKYQLEGKLIDKGMTASIEPILQEINNQIVQMKAHGGMVSKQIAITYMTLMLKADQYLDESVSLETTDYIFHVNELYKAGLILKDNTDELIERAYKRQNRLLDSSERLSQQYHEGLESMVSDGYSSMPSKNRR